MSEKIIKVCHAFVLNFPKMNDPCDCWYFSDMTSAGPGVAHCVECGLNYDLEHPANVKIANAFARDKKVAPIR